MLSFLTVAHATIINAPKPTGLGDPNSAIGQVCNAATWIFAAAIVFSIVYALLAAFTYMSSAGDPGKVKTATNRLIYVAIGVIVALIAFLFPGIIASIIGAGTPGSLGAC